MGERLYSTVLLAILLGCLFGARTGFSNPVPDEDVQNDQGQPNSTAKVLQKHESLQVAEGDSVTMSCNIKFEQSKNAVLWYNGTVSETSQAIFVDGDIVDKAKEDYYKKLFKVNTDDMSLVIYKVTPQTAGNYMCFVSPEAYSTHTVGIKVNVEIGHVQKVVGIGDNIVLFCKVSGYPEPKVEWRRKKSSDSLNTWTLIGTNAEQIISNVDASDSGSYMCSASNSMSGDSKSVSINVIKDGLTAEQDIVYVDPQTKEALLCCHLGKMTKEKPSPVRFYKGKTEIYEMSRFDVQVHGKSKLCLNISKITDEDLGTYECKTDKGQGVVSKASITLTGAPQKPILEVVNVDETKNPVLKWKVTALSPITNYEILVRKQGADDWVPYAKDTILGNDIKQEIIEQKFDQLSNGKYQTKLLVWNKHGFAEYHSEDMPLIVDKPGSHLEPGSGTGGASKNYAGVCVLATTILMTLLHR